MLRFCPKCGSLMTLKREGEKIVWVCPTCKHEEVSSSAGSPAPTVIRQKIEHSEREKIVVVDSSLRNVGATITRAVCPRCGHDKAYVWVVQTRRADEPPTRFFRCAKCNHVWREYD